MEKPEYPGLESLKFYGIEKVNINTLILTQDGKKKKISGKVRGHNEVILGEAVEMKGGFTIEFETEKGE